MRDRRKQRAMRKARAQKEARFPLGENRNRDPAFYEAMSNISREHSARMNRQFRQET